ncbi:MAG: hypothetical protein KDF59_08170 [Nitrosomonas sp.]|nr:hypothetical protein [Nitrosomonas sp.]
MLRNKSKVISVLSAAALVLGLCAQVSVAKPGKAKHSAAGHKAKNEMVAPAGFDSLVLYIGAGIFDPSVSETRPGVTGCTGLFCDGDFFQKNIMNRTDAEVAEIRENARQHFIMHFGVDVDDPAYAGRVSLTQFMVNPDFQYRVHALAGEQVPSDGWIIRDGGYQFLVTDPNGIYVNDPMMGQIHVPAGSGGFFGNYNILKTDKHGNPNGELIIFYQSDTPAIPLPNGDFYFKCTMFNDDWGQGIGMGTMNFVPLEDGRVRGNVRNVLSFPPVSTVTEFPAEPAFDTKP